MFTFVQNCSFQMSIHTHAHTRTVSDSAVSVAPRDLLARRMLAEEEEEDMTKTMVRSTLPLFRPRMIQRPEVIIQLKGIRRASGRRVDLCNFHKFFTVNFFRAEKYFISANCGLKRLQKRPIWDFGSINRVSVGPCLTTNRHLVSVRP